MKHSRIFIFLISGATAAMLDIPGDSLAIPTGIESASAGGTILVQPGTCVGIISFNRAEEAAGKAT